LAQSPWLANAALLVAGPEPKMVETLRPLADKLAADITIDDAVRETDARWLPDGEFIATVTRLFAQPTVPPAVGWEPSSDAGSRVLDGIRRAETAGGGDIVVCSGGRALTSLLLTIGVVDVDHAFSHWQRIAMPDIAVLDIPTDGRPGVIRGFVGTG